MKELFARLLFSKLPNKIKGLVGDNEQQWINIRLHCLWSRSLAMNTFQLWQPRRAGEFVQKGGRKHTKRATKLQKGFKAWLKES